MAICDAHNGMAENIERLRDGQDKLFDLTTKTSISVTEMSGHVAQLFELTAQGEEHRKATDVHFSSRVGIFLSWLAIGRWK